MAGAEHAIITHFTTSSFHKSVNIYLTWFVYVVSFSLVKGSKEEDRGQDFTPHFVATSLPFGGERGSASSSHTPNNTNKKGPINTDPFLFVLVAGSGFEPETFGL